VTKNITFFSNWSKNWLHLTRKGWSVGREGFLVPFPVDMVCRYLINLKIFFGQSTSSVDLLTSKSKICYSQRCDYYSQRVEDDEDKNNPREWRRKKGIDCANKIESNRKTEQSNSYFCKYGWTEGAVCKFDAAYNLETKARENMSFA
jgi:hypothetical protein